MTIIATTSDDASCTVITREDDSGVHAPQVWTGLTLDEVKQLHSELGEVIEFAERKSSRSRTGKHRRPLGEKKA
jgi:hypothetical protein